MIQFCANGRSFVIVKGRLFFYDEIRAILF